MSEAEDLDRACSWRKCSNRYLDFLGNDGPHPGFCSSRCARANDQLRAQERIEARHLKASDQRRRAQVRANDFHRKRRKEALAFEKGVRPDEVSDTLADEIGKFAWMRVRSNVAFDRWRAQFAPPRQRRKGPSKGGSKGGQ